jgi:TonB-linked SusC/RagA family outer membrane protein
MLIFLTKINNIVGVLRNYYDFYRQLIQKNNNMRLKFNWILTFFLVFAVQVSFAQTKTISGKVSDNTGPLPGVVVIVKGTNTGTETDFDGNYSIKAKKGAVLEFSYIGMQATTKTVGSSNTIDIVLQEDTEALEEVVITAFGSKRQAKSLGYAAVKVTASELQEVSTSNPLENLSGKIAGVDISSPAQPGASTKIIVRGTSSITGSNTPLYIVDGSPIQDRSNSSIGSSSSFDAGSGINDIDPNNIASINFLKGAAATALYGSRGANGVIVITTKKGKDKLRINFSSSYDFLEVARTPHFQNEFGTGWSGASYSNVTGEGSTAASNENGSWGPAFSGEIRPWSRIIDGQQLIKPYVGLPDNVRQFYDIGHSKSNSLSISGGSEKSDVALTFSRVEMDGVFPTDADSFAKNNIGVNAGLKSDKLTVRLSGNYVNKKQKAVPTGQGDDAGFGKSLTQEMIQIPNDLSILDMKDLSNQFYSPSYFYTPYTTNPYATLENNKVSIFKDRFYGNVNLSYEISESLSANYQISTDVDNETIKRTGAIVEWIEGSPQDNASANGVVGSVQEAKYTNKEVDTYFNLNYNTDINDDLKLSVLTGVNYNQRTGNSLKVTVKGLDLPDYYELSNSAATPTLVQSDYERKVIGVYSQATLDYLDKYFLTLSARNDYSSTLPIKNNSYFYPSASLAAVIQDDENGFTKLRAGASRIGNDTNLYSVFATAGQSSNDGYFGSIEYPFSGVNGNEIYGTIENQDLKPEITDEIEVGFEGRYFNNRVSIDLSLYNRKTTDLIVDLPVARSTGYSLRTGNYVDLTNKGIELAISAKPIVTEDFTWEMNYTFTKNNSNVDKVANESGKISIYSAYAINFYAEEGKPLGAFYAPTPDTTDDGKIIADETTGYYTYSGEEAYAGSAQRDFVMGLKNSFKYKNFKLNMSFDWKQGGKLYSYTKRLAHFVGNGIETTYNGRNAWIIPNSVVSDGAGGYVENTTAVQHEDVTAFYNTSQNAAIEGGHIIDKTFIRMRDISLAYSFPSNFVDKLNLSSLSMSVYGKNLFLWTPGENPYIDPETTSYGRGIRSDFGEFATNPSQRTYGASLKLSF